MAFVENIIQNKSSIDRIIQSKQRKETRLATTYKKSAITIQRHYRGHYTRSYLLKLNLAAIIIQKHWRGYIDRKYFNDLAIKTFVTKSVEYYNWAATTVQRYYKGYYTRKHVLDVKKMTKWIEEIQEKNHAMSITMKEYKQNISTEFEKMNKEKVKCMIVDIVYKLHPKLRTKAIKGVFSKKENVHSDSEFEALIRNIYSRINKN